MSLHEKERNKKMPTPRHKVTHNPIPTSLFHNLRCARQATLLHPGQLIFPTKRQLALRCTGSYHPALIIKVVFKATSILRCAQGLSCVL